MLTFPLPEYCDSDKHAIKILNECSNALTNPNNAMSLWDYGAENEVLSSDYKSIESTKALDLRYNRVADHYMLVSLQYDSECKIRYTKKDNAYIKVLGAKYKLDSFLVSKGAFDGVHTLSNTSALGIFFSPCGDTVYTKVIY